MKKIIAFFCLVLINSCAVNKPLGPYYDTCFSRNSIYLIVFLENGHFYYAHENGDTIRGVWEQKRKKIALYSDSFWPHSAIKDYDFFYKKYKSEAMAFDSAMESAHWAIMYQLTTNDSMDILFVSKNGLVPFDPHKGLMKDCFFKKVSEKPIP